MFKIYNQNQNHLSNIVTNNNNNIQINVKKQTNILFNINSSRNCQKLKFQGNVKCVSCGGTR